MGLLDDAIREHLELKRKPGADPEAVARHEDEALGRGGPRAEFAQPGATPEPGPVAEAPPEAPEADERPAGEPGIEEEPSEGHTADAPGYDEDPWLDDEPDEVPADEALEHREPQAATGEE